MREEPDAVRAPKQPRERRRERPVRALLVREVRPEDEREPRAGRRQRGGSGRVRRVSPVELDDLLPAAAGERAVRGGVAREQREDLGVK